MNASFFARSFRASSLGPMAFALAMAGLAGVSAFAESPSASPLAAADPSPVEAGAKMEKVAGGFAFTEGPCADAAGNVYFTDQPNDRIMKVAPDGTLSAFLKPAGRSNGMTIDADGNLYACADGDNEIWRITPDGNHSVIAKIYKRKAFNGPNDLVRTQAGGFFFTDPYYERGYWSVKGQRQPAKGVYRLDPGSAEPVLVDGKLSQPNGIALSADGKTLFVSDIDSNKTWRYAVKEDGSLADKKLFCSLGSDGMTIDSEGNLYLTGKGVTIYSPEGKKLVNLRLRESWTANVCFGGADRKWLYVTASAGLYRIRMRVAGQGTYGK